MTRKKTASMVTTAPIPFDYHRIVSMLLFLILLLTWMLAVPLMAAEIKTFNYTVAAGDTLYLISLRYNTTVNTLISLNSLTTTELRVGQLLRVPLPTDSAKAGSYLVKPGDTLYLISQRFGTTVEELKAANSLTTEMIMPGQKLLLPENSHSFEYLVQPGDTLYLISVRFSTTVEKIKTINHISTDIINVGQSLTIPRTATVPLKPQLGSYTVKSGDTLYLLSQRYGTTVQRIMEINQLTSTNLWAGQVLLIPGYDSNKEPPPPPPPTPPTASWTIPKGVSLIHVAPGQSFWDLEHNYNTKRQAIMTTNHLHTDMLMINQPLFIPVNSTTPASVDAPRVASKTGYGEWLDWEFASWIFDPYNEAVLKDLLTGREFRVRRYGGSNHADCEPLTAEDTSIMKEIYGGNWSWDRRAVLVKVGDRVIAGSMAGMPHGTMSIYDNNFNGHFDLHFLNSRTHNTNLIDPKHQEMVKKAAGY